MRIGQSKELPTERRADYERARVYAWASIAFMITAIVAIYLTLGSSQAMKAAWIEDLVSLVPPISFLIAGHMADKPPDAEHPYGYHRGVSIAYLFSSVVLLGMGTYILYESIVTLVSREHPTIATVSIFGQTFWMGWLMIAALIYTIGPAVWIGRKMLPLAARLNDKALFANARMLKADWGTAVAGVVGIIGIGLGLWWADALAAIVISADIVHDGWTNSRTAARELADGRPRLVDGSAVDPLRARLQTELEAIPWIDQAHVRVRDEGHVFFAEALVVPVGEVEPERVEKAVDDIMSVDWRLHDLVISPVASIELGYEEESRP